MGVVGTILGTAGAASAISGAAGIGSTIASNKANKDIAQMNNQFNEKMLQKQMDYNTEMYNRQLGDAWQFYEDQKQYNSASAQAERLREAGLNPALLMGGNNAGTVQSPSTPSAQGVNPPTASQYTADYSGIAGGVAMAIDAYNQVASQKTARDKLQAETKQINIENQYKAGEAIARINNLIEDTNDKRSKWQIAQFLKGFQADLMRAQTTSAQQDAVYKGEQAKLTTLQALQAQTQLKFLPEQLRTQLALQGSQIAYNYALGELTKKQMATEVQKVAESVARASYMRSQQVGQDFSNRVNQATYTEHVRLIKESLIKAINSSGPSNPFEMIGSAGRWLFGTNRYQ